MTLGITLVRGVVTLLTIPLLVLIIRRYKLELIYDKIRDMADIGERFYSGRRGKKMALELVICALHTPPGAEVIFSIVEGEG